jgi:hypothetical protein
MIFFVQRHMSVTGSFYEALVCDLHVGLHKRNHGFV